MALGGGAGLSGDHLRMSFTSLQLPADEAADDEGTPVTGAFPKVTIELGDVKTADHHDEEQAS
jgi:hypothetical protein